VLAVKALALPGRREVILPSFAYRRMADIVAWCHLVPRFCEIDPDTLAMTADTVAACLSADTALVLGVQPIVNCLPADEIEALAHRNGVPLLIDSVESCFETYRGRKVGTFGDAEVFSLHASKLINGFEGGYLTTNDAGLARRLFYMRGFGFTGHDSVEYLGTNAKLNEVHAAMALASLDDLEDQAVRNRERYLAYRKALADLPGLRLLEFDERERTSYKNIVVELTDAWPLSRQLTLEILVAERVQARTYYSPALHELPLAYPTAHGPLPVSEAAARRLLILPSGARVSVEDIGEIVGLLALIERSAAQLKVAV
jgi:dTDP-4-amino-4,6-dideoxygalactose transaminase